MASKSCVVQEKAVRKLFSELKEDVNGASPAKLVKLLKALPQKLEDEDDDELELSRASNKVLEAVVDAISENRKIEVVGADDEEEEEKPVKKARGRKAKAAADDDEDEEDDDDDEPAPKKRGKKADPKAKKAKRSRSGGGGGPSIKDRVFELWLKNPSLKTAKKVAAKFQDVQLSTIRGWMSNWKRGPGDASYPRAAKGREKEIKAACKRAE